MKHALKVTSLAVLVASTVSLPPAMAEMHTSHAKCQAKMGMSKCTGKCGSMNSGKAKCSARDKCGANSKGMTNDTDKCGAKCASKR